jgi:hypothetical protein
MCHNWFVVNFLFISVCDKLTIPLKMLLTNSRFNRTTLLTASLLAYACALFLWIEPIWRGTSGQCIFAEKYSHPFYFQPYISNLLASFIGQAYGGCGEVLLGRFLLPLASFALLIGIFKRHLSLLWSIALALLALSAIAEYPFRDFLIQFIKGDFSNLGNANLPEILKFPIPSFSTLWFLLFFYLATDKPLLQLNNTKTTALTIMFSLMVYVNAIDAIFALVFWFVYFPVRWWRRDQSITVISFKFATQLILGILIIAPALIKGRVDGSLSASASVGLYYIFAYFVVPILLIFLLFLVQRIDPKELFFNFRHIYLLIFAEIMVFSLSYIGVLPLNLEIVEHRIVQFFSHVYYYVPIIHFASRPSKIPAFGTERTIIAKSLRTIMNFIFSRCSSIYLPIAIILLFAYNFSSGFHYMAHFNNNGHFQLR